MPPLSALTARWVLRTAMESRASYERNPNAETKTPRSEGDLGAHWGARMDPLVRSTGGAYRIRTCDFHRVRAPKHVTARFAN